MAVHGPRGRQRRVDEPLDVEVEVERERAEALGRAGRRLEAALTDRGRAIAVAGGPLPAAQEEAHIAAIADGLYRLLIQRECSGARHGNLAAILAAYEVPPAALRRL